MGRGGGRTGAITVAVPRACHRLLWQANQGAGCPPPYRHPPRIWFDIIQNRRAEKTADTYLHVDVGPGQTPYPCSSTVVPAMSQTTSRMPMSVRFGCGHDTEAESSARGAEPSAETRARGSWSWPTVDGARAAAVLSPQAVAAARATAWWRMMIDMVYDVR